MSDPLDEFFGDLRDPKDYPGKRKPALRDQPTKSIGGPQPLDTWDDHPRVLLYQGVKTDFFTIRNVALALHRSVRTVRNWERREIIPPATFRSTRPRTSALKHVGDRLWTRAQVEAMVRIAKEEKVLDGLPPGPRFTAKLVCAFLALQQPPHSNS